MKNHKKNFKSSKNLRNKLKRKKSLIRV